MAACGFWFRVSYTDQTFQPSSISEILPFTLDYEDFFLIMFLLLKWKYSSLGINLGGKEQSRPELGRDRMIRGPEINSLISFKDRLLDVSPCCGPTPTYELKSQADLTNQLYLSVVPTKKMAMEFALKAKKNQTLRNFLEIASPSIKGSLGKAAQHAG